MNSESEMSGSGSDMEGSEYTSEDYSGSNDDRGGRRPSTGEFKPKFRDHRAQTGTTSRQGTSDFSEQDDDGAACARLVAARQRGVPVIASWVAIACVEVPSARDRR